MKWKRNTGFDQVEDRRSQGPTGGGLGDVFGTGGGGGGGFPIPIPGGKAGGGIGLGGIIILVIGFLLFSGILGGGGALSGLQPNGGAGQPGGTLDPQGDTDQQLAYIVNSVQTFWGNEFQRSGKTYPQTKLVLFTGSTTSACGPASSQTGPFYCPADQKVYFDLAFMDDLKSRFGAQGGDFAMAYVVAHEFGHHVQDALGINQAMQDQMQADSSRQSDLSVRLELQADCLAGVWANSAVEDIEPGDIDEALSAAAAVGDDRIQAKTQGRVDPETWTHGSAEERTRWFTKGYQGGNANDCDTFGASSL
jgi:predicted metalloprotease